MHHIFFYISKIDRFLWLSLLLYGNFGAFNGIFGHHAKNYALNNVCYTGFEYQRVFSVYALFWPRKGFIVMHNTCTYIFQNQLQTSKLA